MSDSPFPAKNPTDQGSDTSPASSAGNRSDYAPPDEIGKTIDPHRSIQNSSGSTTVGNQSNLSGDDDFREIPASNQSMQSTRGADTLLETWFDKNLVDEMQSRWNVIQFQFVDSPCTAVEQGDALVAEIMEKLSQILAEKQNSLNQQWLNHDDITTEELRITLQNYRTFLNRLLKL
jgi:hypothetical protein